MRLTSRLLFSLIASVGIVSLTFAYVQMRANRRGLDRELARHALVLAETLSKSAQPLLKNHSYRELQRLVDQFQNREQIAGVAVLNPSGEPLAISSRLVPRLDQSPGPVRQAVQDGLTHADFVTLAGDPFHVIAMPLREDPKVIGILAIFHDAAYIDQQTAALWRRALTGVAIQTVLIALITLLTVRLGFGRPLKRTTEWLREFRIGASPTATAPITEQGDLEPLTQEVSRLASSLLAARAAAEREAGLRVSAESNWTADRLRVFVRGRLGGDHLFAVSNREPYEHVHTDKGIQCLVPASGLVTALEPVLCACSGTWIAQGTGNADRESVDQRDRVRVPPEHNQYTLRRVWLTPQEERGFYLGFANEGLWPLCHIAYNRPIFRASDWEAYRAVNERFAQATLQEIDNEENPLVLVQDYHFALLPRMIKRVRQDARVAIFWHIPWPNPEAFGICPWQRDLLEGLLAADLIGFHIQAHCNNFLETVDRSIECRIDREHFSINCEGHRTVVEPFPISVAVDQPGPAASSSELPHLERAALLAKLGVRATYMGVGVDRIDYTKGIPERFRGHRALSWNCVPPIATSSPSFKSDRPAAPASAAIRTWLARSLRKPSASIAASRMEAGNPLSCLPASIATKKSCPTTAPPTSVSSLLCTTA